MSLILATGSNLGDKLEHLNEAKDILSHHFNFIAESRIYKSAAIEYEKQPEFVNQLLEFEIPNTSPQETIKKILDIEKEMGRRRDITKGPRVIDIDIIFWKTEQISEDNLKIPHPAWSERSFVTLPLAELPYFEVIKKNFIIPKQFSNSAEAI